MIGIANFVFALLSTVVIKYFGMRTIMISGQIGMAICHLLIGIGEIYHLYMLMYISMLVFVAIFQLTIGTVIFIYVAEVTVDSAIGFVSTG